MEIKKIGLPLRYSLSQGLRVGQFLTQVMLSNMAFGRRAPKEITQNLPPLKAVLSDLTDLFARDLKNIEAGIYKEPKEFGVGNLVDFSFKSFQSLVDLFKVERRRASKAVNKFSKNIPMDEFPKYFAQTFHFQTDGYLSDASANLYDHQVELVFAGGAQAMRRQALVPIYHYLHAQRERDNTQLTHLLDVACGTGLFLEMLKDNYPELRCTGLDLSTWYLKKARQKLQRYDHIDFVEANAESIPFRDNQFEIVTSVFLFHELPRRVRKNVLQEMTRILSPGGIMVIEDSMQRDDKPLFNASLDNFPYLFHEPYFLDFVGQDLRALFKEVGLELVSVELAFFSKIWVLRKVSA